MQLLPGLLNQLLIHIFLKHSHVDHLEYKPKSQSLSDPLDNTRRPFLQWDGLLVQQVTYGGRGRTPRIKGQGRGQIIKLRGLRTAGVPGDAQVMEEERS